MRVGISTSVIQRGRSGVGQYVLALLRQFAEMEQGWEFSIFALEDDLPLFEFAKDRMRLIPVEERHRAPVADILWHQRVLPALAREHRLDILHVPSYRRLLWSKPCPLVGTIHDLAPFRLSGKYDWKRMLYGRVVVRRLAHRQDRIIAVSQETAKDIGRYFNVPRERITVIHNGVDHERFSPEGTAESKDFCHRRFNFTKPFFLYVARIEHPGKNHIRLIHAFERFKRETGSQWQLAFGGADWHGAEAVHQAAKESAATEDIHFLGFVSDVDLPHLYRAASVFVYPSLFEGFGMPPVEAMASGCPVICSTRGALGEVVGTAAHIIDPERVDSIKEKLALVATDAGAWNAAKAAGLERARQFTWRLAALSTLQVYSLACGCTLKPSEPAFRS